MPNPTGRKPSLLIAFGGNALNVPGDRTDDQKAEFIVAAKSMEPLTRLIQQGYEKVVLTHGNGPQVGQIFLQQELTAQEFPRQVTLDVCVADSQGRIGYILQNVFDNLCQKQGIDRRSFTVITQVVVDPDDPAFRQPTKPIGLFYSKGEADRLSREKNWSLMEDAGRGFRRVIPSPRPLDIVEKNLFSKLLNEGVIAIGAGGGGIPVIRNSRGELQGIEAVIDKDRTSALLANEAGIETLVILTQVDHVYLDYHQPNQRPITQAKTGEMEAWLAQGHFAEGSMKPKVEATIQFLRAGGRRAIIAHLNHLYDAVEGTAGTQIFPD